MLRKGEGKGVLVLVRRAGWLWGAAPISAHRGTHPRLPFLPLPGAAAVRGTWESPCCSNRSCPKKWEAWTQLPSLRPWLMQRMEGLLQSPSNFFLVTDVTSVQDLYSCWELLYCTRRPLEDNQTVSKEKKKESLDKLLETVVQNYTSVSLQKAVFHSWAKTYVLSYKGTPLQHFPSKLNSQLRARHSPSPSNELEPSARASPETAPYVEIQKCGCKILVCETAILIAQTGCEGAHAVCLNKCIHASLFMIIKVWRAKCVLDTICCIDLKALSLKSIYTL